MIDRGSNNNWRNSLVLWAISLVKHVLQKKYLIAKSLSHRMSLVYF